MRILVVWGLGGAGKSQLVLNYIQEYREDYRAVFWIEAGSKETIERDYIQIYGLLYNRSINADQEMVKVEDVVPAVKCWFQGREGRWLVVLDSADTIDNEQDQSYIDLDYFLPDAPGVHVVITSRSSTAQEMTRLEAVEVGKMEPSEATELFQRSAKIMEVGSEAIEEIRRITEELGYLALAITLAGSYVSVTPRLSSDIGRYLPEYRQRRKELLQRRPKQHVHRYGESVLSTWETSFEAIAKQDPPAARLLCLLAFVNFEDIFPGLLGGDETGVLGGGPEGSAGESEATVSSDQTWRSYLSGEGKWTLHNLEAALATLQSYCLLQWRSDQGSYTMHKLVHAWGHDRLETEEQRSLSGLALELMAEATGKEAHPSERLRLVPHVMASFGALTRWDPPLGERAEDVLAMVNRIEGFLYGLGKWSEAYGIRLFHLTKVEMILGKEHPSTLTSMNNLALVLRSQGKYGEAEQMHRQALALSESVLGKEHPDTLTSMNNLAATYWNQGRWEEAEGLEVRVMETRKKTLGAEHPDTLASMHNLAFTWKSQSRSEEAISLMKDCFERRKQTLGAEHPGMKSSFEALRGWENGEDELERSD